VPITFGKTLVLENKFPVGNETVIKNQISQQVNTSNFLGCNLYLKQRDMT